MDCALPARKNPAYQVLHHQIVHILSSTVVNVQMMSLHPDRGFQKSNEVYLPQLWLLCLFHYCHL